MRMHQILPFFKKNGQKLPFVSQKLSFFALDKQLTTPPPILRVLDAKKHVVWTHGSPKHNLQHANYLKGGFFSCCRFSVFWTS